MCRRLWQCHRYKRLAGLYAVQWNWVRNLSEDRLAFRSEALAMNPIAIVLAWVGAFFIALVLKNYVRAFAGWNFFLLVLLGLVIESFGLAFGVAFLGPLFR